MKGLCYVGDGVWMLVLEVEVDRGCAGVAVGMTVWMGDWEKLRLMGVGRKDCERRS